MSETYISVVRETGLDAYSRAREKMAKRTAMKRLGKAEDVAQAALFMASPGASWVTGKLLEVDGNPS